MGRLANFHIMFFAVIMGLGGFGMAYKKLNEIMKFDDVGFVVFRVFVSAIFILIVFFYILKIFTNLDKVKEELSHPIKINFFATVPISMLILASLWQDVKFVYEILFYIGVVFQTYFTFYVISFWINKNLEIKHSNPAWFIPIVGNLIIIVGAKEIASWMWFYFSVAMFFWVVLFSLVFYRILFHDQLPSKFMPTLFIMIAPPAVGFLDYIKLTNSFDLVAIFLLNLAMFFTFLVIFMYKNFFNLKFFISWWAFTFPTAAISIACFKAYEITNSIFFLNLANLIFILLVAMIVFISYHTIKNIVNQNICMPE